MPTKPSLDVYERFASIQGESTHAGLPCFFIRLAGCNLRCRFCDTEYALETAHSSVLTVEDLVQEALRSTLPLVEITGGEPLLQTATPALAKGLLDAGLVVLVETNGSLPIDRLPEGAIRILDCKTPSSGEQDRMDPANYERLGPFDEVKFVLADENDYAYALAVIGRHRLREKTSRLLFGPVWGRLDPAELAAWILRDHAPVRLQIQLHKVLWGPDRKGV
jgi:7-carboxy-7-deazaguanine synthase